MGTIASQLLSGGSRKIRVQGQHMPKMFANFHVAFSLGAGEIHGKSFHEVISCSQALPNEVHCTVLDAVVQSTPPLDCRAVEMCSLK